MILLMLRVVRYEMNIGFESLPQGAKKLLAVQP